MSAIDYPQPAVYESQPSIVVVYKLQSPLHVHENASDQVDNIFFKSQLVAFNQDTLGIDDDSDRQRLYGISMHEALQKNYQRDDSDSRASPAVVSEQTRHQLLQFVNNNYILENRPAPWAPRYKHCYVSYYGMRDNDQLTHIVAFYKDEGSTELQEQLVSNIAQSLVGETQESFFIHLVKCLTNSFGLDYAAVSEIVPGAPGKVKMLSFHNRRDDKYVQINGECQIKSPGLEVLEGKVQVYPANVRSLFPDNTYLGGLEVDGFIGVPIMGEHFEPSGAIWLMHRGEIPNPDLMRAVANIFAIRAAAELQRERHHKESSLREQQQLAFIKNNSSGMFVVDVDPPMDINLSLQKQVQWLAEKTRFVECNDASVSLLGYPDRDSLLGQPLFGYSVEYDFATTTRTFITEGYQSRDQIIKITPKNGVSKWMSSTNSSVIRDGKLMQILGMVTDVTDRIMRSKEMEYRARHDSLTGLANRSYFIEQVEQVLSLSLPSSRHALFLLDLDGFKEVNDTLGHEIGDCLLQQIGPRVMPVLEDKDTVFSRLGGDEFAVFIRNYQDLKSLINLAGSLMRAIKSPFPINELELTISGSVGISLYSEDGDSVSSLMRCADVAMYQAKQQSQDYCLYSSDQDHHTVRRLSLMMDVRQAIDNNELTLHYQPIIDLEDKQVISFEVLIRWQHPVHGMLAPGEFVPLIELTDMIQPMTRWVVETAIEQLSIWLQRDWSYRIAVNVSTRNLIDAGFVNFIESCLSKYQVDGSHLELEITESTLMADPDKARRVLQQLSELGVSISIDDYGTGYSSLAYLKSLPITTLKIDRTFISQMVANVQDRIIVNSTVQLAHNLGLEVTAEGIEDQSLIRTLYELGCDKGQGFFICRPIALVEIDSWLEMHRHKVLSQSQQSFV